MKRFFAAAAGMGAAFANINVIVPLQLNALHRPPALTGALLAGGTLAVAVGAVAAGLGSARAGGGARLLATALLVTASGGLVFALGDSTVLIGLAAVLVGFGIGVFWVASMQLLGTQSGNEGSERGFIVHYASYTAGAVTGSTLTGGVVAVAEHAGIGTPHAIRLAGLVGAAAVGAAFLQWLPRALRTNGTRVSARSLATPTRHLMVQLADLFLVGALAVLLPMTPLVLAHQYRLGPLPIGITMASMSCAKVAGTFVAGRLTRAGGHRRSIVFLLALGAGLCAVLCFAFDAPFFVASLFASTLTIAGAWPIVVDAAQARVAPERRLDLSVLWNAREYAVVAAGTALSGWAYGRFDTPVPLYAAAAVLVAAGAACAAVVLARRPVWRPAPAFA